MSRYARPRVVFSRCLEFDSCRYDGSMISSDFVRSLLSFVDPVPVCPEFDLGLGVPRKPIRIVYQGGHERLIQPATDLDLTVEMNRFCEAFLSGLPPVDGFVLKSRSPSCGLKDIRLYFGSGRSPPRSKRAGFFGEAVRRRYEGLAIEDEWRLRNLAIRNNFLTRLYALAAFRSVTTPADLVSFHTNNKLLLMAHDQAVARFLGRLVANQDGLEFSSVLDYYQAHLRQALARNPRRTTNIHVLKHAMGLVSDQLKPPEKEYFQQVLQEYRHGRISLSVASAIVRGWAVRFDQPYLLDQSFFWPYPEELIEICLDGCQLGSSPKSSAARSSILGLERFTQR